MKAVAVFLALHNQWRYHPNGKLAGLDLAAVDAAIRLMGVKPRRAFEKILILENEVLAVKVGNGGDGGHPEDPV